MLELTSAQEQSAEAAIRDFVLHQARLGIYDPMQPRRPKVDVASFSIEMLDADETDSVIHAAGPVVLRGPEGDVERFLRVSMPVTFEGDACLIAPDAAYRAAYIVETDPETGACKETIAVANA
jgi:hypothetical protein